jgi:hypothetical protein
VEPGDRGSGLAGPRHPPADDAAPGGADALRAAPGQRAAADRAQTGVYRRTYVRRWDFGHGGERRCVGSVAASSSGASLPGRGGPHRSPRW